VRQNVVGRSFLGLTSSRADGVTCAIAGRCI
jgi:hypothetical protein